MVSYGVVIVKGRGVYTCIVYINIIYSIFTIITTTHRYDSIYSIISFATIYAAILVITIYI